MSTLLMQISDTHFGVERPPVCDALRRLARAQQPGVLLLSGDITQRARASQFAAARTFIDSLGIAVQVTLPGNHDIALFDLFERLLAPYRSYRRVFGNAHDAVVDAEGVRIVSVDSTRAYRHVDGELSAGQIEAVAHALGGAPTGAMRIVMLHHPVAVSRPDEKHNRVHGHREAVIRWRAAGADLVLGGHIHLPFVRRLDGDGLRTAWAVQAGTAVSERTRPEAGNSVNLIRAITLRGARSAVVERWDYCAASDRFEPGALSALALDAHR
jgi:3',5'-cyclic AMP phosphodiesterase CpdA